MEEAIIESSSSIDSTSISNQDLTSTSKAKLYKILQKYYKNNFIPSIHFKFETNKIGYQSSLTIINKDGITLSNNKYTSGICNSKKDSIQQCKNLAKKNPQVISFLSSEKTKNFTDLDFKSQLYATINMYKFKGELPTNECIKYEQVIDNINKLFKFKLHVVCGLNENKKSWSVIGNSCTSKRLAMQSASSLILPIINEYMMTIPDVVNKIKAPPNFSNCNFETTGSLTGFQSSIILQAYSDNPIDGDILLSRRKSELSCVKKVLDNELIMQFYNNISNKPKLIQEERKKRKFMDSDYKSQLYQAISIFIGGSQDNMLNERIKYKEISTCSSSSSRNSSSSSNRKTFKYEIQVTLGEDENERKFTGIGEELFSKILAMQSVSSVVLDSVNDYIDNNNGKNSIYHKYKFIKILSNYYKTQPLENNHYKFNTVKHDNNSFQTILYLSIDPKLLIQGDIEINRKLAERSACHKAIINSCVINAYKINDNINYNKVEELNDNIDK
jgi:hypothetical protein